MSNYIDIDEKNLPSEDGFEVGGLDILTTNHYLMKLTDQISNGLTAVDNYPEFVQAFQMDLL